MNLSGSMPSIYNTLYRYSASAIEIRSSDNGSEKDAELDSDYYHTSVDKGSAEYSSFGSIMDECDDPSPATGKSTAEGSQLFSEYYTPHDNNMTYSTKFLFKRVMILYVRIIYLAEYYQMELLGQ